MLIGHPLAGCARFSCFSRSVSASFAFPCVSATLIGCPFAGCVHFPSFGRSLSAPLAFPCVSAFLLAVLWLVVHIFPLLVAR